jgi:REP element-mobilizing transposase RayT
MVFILSKIVRGLAGADVLARERVEAWGGRLIEVNGEADHVHMLFTLPPKVYAGRVRQCVEDDYQSALAI